MGTYKGVPGVSRDSVRQLPSANAWGETPYRVASLLSVSPEWIMMGVQPCGMEHAAVVSEGVIVMVRLTLVTDGKVRIAEGLTMSEDGRVTTKAADRGCEEGDPVDGLVSEKARIKVPKTSMPEIRAMNMPIVSPFILLVSLFILVLPSILIEGFQPVWLESLMQMTRHPLNLRFL